MKRHNLIQGSDAWHEFRLNHFGASEAAAMLGVSKKTTRNELLRMKATGNAKEFSNYVQKNIFDYGHEVEALARPLVEAMIDDELYPVTCSDGDLSASCDGLTMAGDIAFEHKQWNESLADSVRDGVLPAEHVPQCQQILMITGATKVIFTVSDGTPENMVTMDVFPSEYFFGQIRAGWDQFAKDLAAYEHKVIVDKPVADSIEAFPVATIQAKGELILSNLPEVLPRFDLFLANQKTDLVTDDDFANGEAVAKFSRETAKKLRLVADQTIDQIASVSEAVRALNNYADQFDGLGLKLEKLVKSEKEARKDSIINAAKLKWREHLDAIDAELKTAHLQIGAPDFLTAVKGKRTIESIENAVDTTLASGKIAADALAKTYRANLAWAHENASEFNFLYANDLSAIVAKQPEDFKNLIESRIANFKTQEADKKAKEAADQAIKTAQVEQPKPEAKPEPVKATVKPAQKEPDLIAGFINSREWPSVAAKNSARAVIVEFLKFQEVHLQAA
jgi:predicted phage-related endonuclease